MKPRNSNDLFLSKKERETQIANVRKLLAEARKEGDRKRVKELEQRLSHLERNLAQEERVRRQR